MQNNFSQIRTSLNAIDLRKLYRENLIKDPLIEFQKDVDRFKKIILRKREIFKYYKNGLKILNFNFNYQFI